MATEWPAPCRIRRGTSGTDYYYFDGVNPMTTFASSNAGAALNNVLGNAGTFDAATTDFDNIQNYLIARKLAFDQLAACETCPTLKGEMGDGELLESLVGSNYEELAGG